MGGFRVKPPNTASRTVSLGDSQRGVQLNGERGRVCNCEGWQGVYKNGADQAGPRNPLELTKRMNNTEQKNVRDDAS